MIKIIAYAYDAAYHCIACTQDSYMVPERYRHRKKMCDEHCINAFAIDSERNPIHPVFDTDETPPATCCGDCRSVITEPFYEQAINSALEGDNTCE